MAWNSKAAVGNAGNMRPFPKPWSNEHLAEYKKVILQGAKVAGWIQLTVTKDHAKNPKKSYTNQCTENKHHPSWSVPRSSSVLHSTRYPSSTCLPIFATSRKFRFGWGFIHLGGEEMVWWWRRLGNRWLSKMRSWLTLRTIFDLRNKENIYRELGIK